jgi:hypothetical protein
MTSQLALTNCGELKPRFDRNASPKLIPPLVLLIINYDGFRTD